MTADSTAERAGRPGEAFRYTFEFGGSEPLQPQRSIEVEFDSAGHVGWFTMMAGRIDDENRAAIDAHVIHFRPFVFSTMIFTGEESQTTREATAEELKQIRELANWLWAHRCPGVARRRPAGLTRRTTREHDDLKEIK